MAELVPAEHPALHTVAEPVPVDEIASEKFQNIIADMKAVLLTQADGVAIAAPQIGESWRIFAVSHKVFRENDEESANEIVGDPTDGDQIYINPRIIKTSKRQKWMEGEGCLSIRWKYGEVKRHTHVTIEAYNEHGEQITRGAGGLLAHIFQHEIDHLDGILFTEKARNLHDVPPEEVEKYHKV